MLKVSVLVLVVLHYPGASARVLHYPWQPNLVKTSVGSAQCLHYTHLHGRCREKQFYTFPSYFSDLPNHCTKLMGGVEKSNCSCEKKVLWNWFFSPDLFQSNVCTTLTHRHGEAIRRPISDSIFGEKIWFCEKMEYVHQTIYSGGISKMKLKGKIISVWHTGGSKHSYAAA